MGWWQKLFGKSQERKPETAASGPMPSDTDGPAAAEAGADVAGDIRLLKAAAADAAVAAAAERVLRFLDRHLCRRPAAYALPRLYYIDVTWGGVERVCLPHRRPGPPQDEGLYFARDVATGFLEELSAFLEPDRAAPLRAVLGNPAAPDPRWRTTDVLGLARGIAADGAFDRLPLLADALLDAGCDNEHLLAHCRQPRPDNGGSRWVVPFLLGVGWPAVRPDRDAVWREWALGAVERLAAGREASAAGDWPSPAT